MKNKAFNDIFDSLAANTFCRVKSFSPQYLALSADNMNMGQEALTESSIANFSKLANSSSLPDKYRPIKQQIRNLVGKNSDSYPTIIGSHPDFAYLESGGEENHYIVSVFVDIKGSTELALKLNDLKEVKAFKDGLITTVIDIFTAFDGHIHRLQGDAVFAFFGRKEMKKSQAIIDALNATTFLQQFCENKLNTTFRKNGFPDLKIRIGIDFGDDDDVLWSKYGIDNCSEVTTTSLHTDLAAKLQAQAPANGIMLGDNVKQFIDLPDEFYFIKKIIINGDRKEKKHVLQCAEKQYRMWQFNWGKYLSRFLFNPERAETESYKAGENFKLQCFYKAANECNWQEYYPNAFPLHTNCLLKFELSDITIPLEDKEIRWYVINRGEEAAREELYFEMEDYKNMLICHQETAFKGHHYMKCEISCRGEVIAREHLGIYINND